MTLKSPHSAEPGSPLLLGVNHRTAPLDLRESMSFSPAETTGLLQAIARERPVAEAAVLSTCNRTEFYLAPDGSAEAAEDRFMDWLSGWREPAVIDRFRTHAYRKRGVEAAGHLFRVASGLDSSVLGDVQVQGQVKEAMRLAAGAGVLRAQLNQVMTQAIRAGRKARTETAIASGSPSIGSAVANLLDTRLRESVRDQPPQIVLIGAGKAAHAIARHITQRWPRVLFVNRTPGKAAEFAAEYGGEPAEWRDLGMLLSNVDVLITATAATEPIVTRPMLQRAEATRSRPLLVIDPSVPRNVESAPAVDLLDIDSVRDQRDANLSAREQARGAVEDIVMVEVDEWLRWTARRPVEALIRRLFEAADAQAARDAAVLAGVGHPEEAEAMLRSSYRKLLHEHVRELRDLVSQSHPGAGHGSKEGAPEG